MWHLHPGQVWLRSHGQPDVVGLPGHPEQQLQGMRLQALGRWMPDYHQLRLRVLVNSIYHHVVHLQLDQIDYVGVGDFQSCVLHHLPWAIVHDPIENPIVEWHQNCPMTKRTFLKTH